MPAADGRRKRPSWNIGRTHAPVTGRESGLTSSRRSAAASDPAFSEDAAEQMWGTPSQAEVSALWHACLQRPWSCPNLNSGVRGASPSAGAARQPLARPFQSMLTSRHGAPRARAG